MKNEIVVAEAVPAAKEAPAASVKIKREGQRNLVGKVARLPYGVREKLNVRLRDNEQSSEILAWLNGISQVKNILAKQFGGKAINHRNLSEWRRGGFRVWMGKQDELEETKALAKEVKKLNKAGEDEFAKGAATMASVKMFKMVRDLRPEECTPDNLSKVSHAAAALVFAEKHHERVAQEKIRVHLRNEQVTLQWDKHQRTVAEIAERILSDHEAKAVVRSSLDKRAKLELIGYRLYNDLWYGREVKASINGLPPFVSLVNNSQSMPPPDNSPAL